MIDLSSFNPEFDDNKKDGRIYIGKKIEKEDGEKQYLRILNSSYHNIHILTYQQLLSRAKNMLSLSEGDVKK